MPRWPLRHMDMRHADMRLLAHPLYMVRAVLRNGSSRAKSAVNAPAIYANGPMRHHLLLLFKERATLPEPLPRHATPLEG